MSIENKLGINFKNIKDFKLKKNLNKALKLHEKYLSKKKNEKQSNIAYGVELRKKYLERKKNKSFEGSKSNKKEGFRKKNIQHGKELHLAYLERKKRGLTQNQLHAKNKQDFLKRQKVRNERNRLFNLKKKKEAYLFKRIKHN